MTPFSVTKDKAELVYHLDENDDGPPVKLGDGSFGIVLRITMLQNVAGALKLFYSNDRPNMKARRKFEMHLSELVVAKEKELNKRVDKSSLILPEAVCLDFRKSEAYQKHREYFAAAGVELSGEGVVMPYYDCTLKDLLESGAPAGRLLDGADIQNAAAPGYSILNKLSGGTREACILPLLRQIAMALQSLHLFGLHHHDLKPANILVKSQGGNLTVALGDLGFADPNMTHTTVVDLNDEAMALGTRHYRSVEQKDYFDVCEADVTVEEGEDQTLRVALHTRDAKFYDSIIERGDLCIFRKDRERTGWPIDEIRRSQDEATFSTTIMLKALNKTAGIASDSRTQVAFLKRQTHRTDLFGFGALAFDMLTAGKSPERFYDLLRPLDRAQDDFQEGQITFIESAYQKFIRAPSAEPRHRTLFNELKTGSTYPTSKFVGMLLRCMLSKPKDSFFSAFSGSAGSFRALVTTVEELIKQHNAMIYLPDKANPLWTGDMHVPRVPSVVSGFEEKLKNHRSTFKASPGALNLCRGYRLLRTLKRTLKDLVARHRDDTTYFTPCDPSHLDADGRIDENSIAYSKKAVFLEALRSGEAVHFRDDIEGNNFLPPCMRYRTRTALFSPQKTPADKSAQSSFVLSYTESIPAWPAETKGDLVRVARDAQPIQLFEIISVSGSTVQFNTIPVAGKSDTSNTLEFLQQDFKGELVKEIDAIDYYLGMLGIYVHQLFFVSQLKVFEPIPGTIWWLEQAACLRAVDWSTLQRNCDSEKAKNPLTGVQLEAAKLYVWLIMRLYKRGGGTADTAPQTSELLGQVSARMRRLTEKVASALGKTTDWLENAMTDEIDAIASEIDKNGTHQNRESDTFENILKTIITPECLRPASRFR